MQSTYSFDHSTHEYTLYYTIFSLEAALIQKMPGEAQACICCCQGDYKQTVVGRTVLFLFCFVFK